MKNTANATNTNIWAFAPNTFTVNGHTFPRRTRSPVGATCTCSRPFGPLPMPQKCPCVYT